MDDSVPVTGRSWIIARRPQGRPPAPHLKGHQAATLVRLITDRCPDQLKLPFALWTREAVMQLLQRRFGLKLSVWTVGRQRARNKHEWLEHIRAYLWSTQRQPQSVRRFFRPKAVRYAA